jgi:hypothetical protein
VLALLQSVTDTPGNASAASGDGQNG